MGGVLRKSASLTPIRSSTRLAALVAGMSLERMLKSSLSPFRAETTPVRAETPSIVPVLARRFRAARVRYIRRSERRASGSVETNASQ